MTPESLLLLLPLPPLFAPLDEVVVIADRAEAFTVGSSLLLFKLLSSLVLLGAAWDFTKSNNGRKSCKYKIDVYNERLLC
jgi:hypothetical protein